MNNNDFFAEHDGSGMNAFHDLMVNGNRRDAYNVLMHGVRTKPAVLASRVAQVCELVSNSDSVFHSPYYDVRAIYSMIEYWGEVVC